MNQPRNSLPAFGIYLHVPFCTVRCGYCDFNTYTPGELEQDNSIDIWTNALIDEITHSLEKLPENKIVETIFFGGGTPSLLPLANLEKIFTKINESFSLSENTEITIEANPDTLTKSKIQAWKSYGINRVSLGVQSSDQKVLATLDRTHKPDNVKKSVALLREENLNNFSLDLIYGTPGEDLDSWRRSLESIIAFDPPHISAYALTVEPGTALFRKVKNQEINNINLDDQADKYLLANELLEKNDLNWYEVSNWSKFGHECKHNLLYWRNQNWWGYGPGAHSHLDGTRWWNVKHPKYYATKLLQENSAVEDYENLNAEQKSLEQVMLQMRLRETKLKKLISPQTLAEWEQLGYVAQGVADLELTPNGRLLLDSLLTQVTA